LIASIEGILISIKKESAVIETGGIGVEVFIPSRTLFELGSAGERVRLFTHMHVREDAIVLYGFASEEDKSMFLSLIGVNGVGPKVAMGILSASTSAQLAGIICNEETGALTAYPGVGRKTSERIILELKDKIDMAEFGAKGEVPAQIMDGELVDEAVSALCSLGFTRNAALKGVKGISLDDMEEAPSIEILVREVLRRNT